MQRRSGTRPFGRPMSAIPWWKENGRERAALIGAWAVGGVIGYTACGWIGLLRTPHHIGTALDDAIPLTPAWVWIYILHYPFPVPLILLSRRIVDLRRAFAAFVLSGLAAYCVFIAFPVEMVRPRLAEIDAPSRVLGFLYRIDPPVNCLPSLHVAVAILVALITWGLDRRWSVALWVLAALISVSTLFVKQHYVWDVVGGVAIAVLGWWVVYRSGWLAAWEWLGFRSPPRDLRAPRTVPDRA